MKTRYFSYPWTMLFLISLLDVIVLGRGTEQEMMEALDETKHEGDKWKYAPLSGPHFDLKHSKNISTQIGKTAVLNCRVKYAGGKTVSWIRVRDLHLLTVGRFTYTSDDRFKAVHQSGSEDWLLKVHYVQHRDQGLYECQVSTTPPISHTVRLTVVAEPETKILGGPDIYINSGSTINLTCLVQHSPTSPKFILWYRDKQLLSYDSPRGGITLVTEHGPESTSRLLIQQAAKTDAGKYSCRPSNIQEHTIRVHIINSEHPAAIHHKNGTSSAITLHCSLSVNHSLYILSLTFIFLTNIFIQSKSVRLTVQGHCYSSRTTNALEQINITTLLKRLLDKCTSAIKLMKRHLLKSNLITQNDENFVVSPLQSKPRYLCL